MVWFVYVMITVTAWTIFKMRMHEAEYY